jgi:hypothetical protein
MYQKKSTEGKQLPAVTTLSNRSLVVHMVSGEGAAARDKTHGSMRRDSIAFILRRLGLSHYTKTQVDKKVAARHRRSQKQK